MRPYFSDLLAIAFAGKYDVGLMRPMGRMRLIGLKCFAFLLDKAPIVREGANLLRISKNKLRLGTRN